MKQGNNYSKCGACSLNTVAMLHADATVHVSLTESLQSRQWL